MSALGQKQICAVQNIMSALPPKADMCAATRDVRFGPKADIGQLIRSLRQPRPAGDCGTVSPSAQGGALACVRWVRAPLKLKSQSLLNFSGSVILFDTTGAQFMRYLRLVILISTFSFGFNTAAFAVCCPGGCVENGYGGCWRTGTNNYCAPTSCQGSPGSSGGGSGGTNTYVAPQIPPPYCPKSYPTPASLDAATNQCVATLSGNAMFWGCLFEDDAGRAEDKRTGLSCPDRQKALASQCRARCASYVASLYYCSDTSWNWQRVFGDIGGSVYGSARVDLCGPRLKTSIGNFIRTRPSNIQIRKQP
jgi:hypothetical protein